MSALSIKVFGQTIPLARLLLTVAILTYFLYFGSYAVQRYLAFETGAYDVGTYAQPIWNYLQGRDFAVSIMKDNGPIRWASHIEPILFLVLPLYKLWPDPRTLLWLQVTALSLAAIPLYALARRRLQSEWLALIIVVAYFLMPATESVTLFDFHAVSMAPVFLLSAIYFLDRAMEIQGRSFWLWPERPARPNSSRLSTKAAYSLSALFFLLALSTKEDISLHVFMIGLYLLVLRRHWRAGSTLAVVGLAWFYVALEVITPAFRTAGGESIYLAWFETLGRTPVEVALSPLTAPDKVFALIFQAGNLPALGMITLPMALLPLVGLPLFALSAPSLAFSFLSQNPTLRQLETWHYAAPMLTFIMLGTIDGLARLNYLGSVISRRWSVARNQSWPNLQSSGLTQSPILWIDTISNLTSYLLPLTLLTTALIYHNLRGYSPLSQLYERPVVTPHHDLGRELAAIIPPEAAVLAQAQLLPYVAHRYQLDIWSGPLFTEYDYIWLDLSHHKLPNRFNAHGEFLTGLVIETDFGPIAATDGYLLLKKGAARDTIPEDLFTFTAFDHLPADAQPFNASFGEELKLLGVKTEVRRLATSETEPQVILYFEVLQKPTIDYHLFVYRLDENGAVKGATDYPQPALMWWPTSRWEAGDRRQVRVNTIPWWSGDQDKFAYALGLSRSTAPIEEAPWDVSARLPVSLINPDDNPPGSSPLDHNTLLPIAAFDRFGGWPYPQPLTTLKLVGNEMAEQ